MKKNGFLEKVQNLVISGIAWSLVCLSVLVCLIVPITIIVACCAALSAILL